MEKRCQKENNTSILSSAIFIKMINKLEKKRLNNIEQVNDLTTLGCQNSDLPLEDAQMQNKINHSLPNQQVEVCLHVILLTNI